MRVSCYYVITSHIIINHAFQFNESNFNNLCMFFYSQSPKLKQRAIVIIVEDSGTAMAQKFQVLVLDILLAFPLFLFYFLIMWGWLHSCFEHVLNVWLFHWLIKNFRHWKSQAQAVRSCTFVTMINVSQWNCIRNFVVYVETVLHSILIAFYTVSHKKLYPFCF